MNGFGTLLSNIKQTIHLWLGHNYIFFFTKNLNKENIPTNKQIVKLIFAAYKMNSLRLTQNYTKILPYRT